MAKEGHKNNDNFQDFHHILFEMPCMYVHQKGQMSNAFLISTERERETSNLYIFFPSFSIRNNATLITFGRAGIKILNYGPRLDWDESWSLRLKFCPWYSSHTKQTSQSTFSYRVFIKYCVFSKIFRTLFSLGVSVCTHTRQVENQRCSRTGGVKKITKF